MRKLIYCPLLFCLIISCSEKIDLGNPKQVLEKYLQFKDSKNYKGAYDLVADTCKQNLLFQEYQDFYKKDSSQEKQKIKVEFIRQLNGDNSLPNYKLYEVKSLKIDEGNDSDFYFTYFTLINENNDFQKKPQWKIIWTGNLSKTAFDLYKAFKYSEAEKNYQRFLLIDPLNGEAINELSWIYIQESKFEEAEDLLTRAKEFAPNYPYVYNSLATLYSKRKLTDIAILNYEKGLNLCVKKEDKQRFLSNIAIELLIQGKNEEAKIKANTALSIDSSETFCWYTLGDIYFSENKFDTAIVYFEKTLKLKTMAGDLQYIFYAKYGATLFMKAFKSSNELDNTQKLKYYLNAKDYFVKALDLNPNEGIASEGISMAESEIRKLKSATK